MGQWWTVSLFVGILAVFFALAPFCCKSPWNPAGALTVEVFSVPFRKYALAGIFGRGSCVPRPHSPEDCPRRVFDPEWRPEAQGPGEDTVTTLQLSEVNSGYDGLDVLRGINLSVTEPSIYVVLGPNGAGKTTLLRTIGGILQPSHGSVAFDGQDVYRSRETRKRMSYLSHLNALPEEMTVREALAFYASIEGGDVPRVMETLQLGPLADMKVPKLSQGQKKRVSIAKTLLNDRDLYLLDEPTSNLDPAMAKEVRDLLLEFSKRKIVLYSSHNLYEAKEIGTYLVLIKGGMLRFFDRIENLHTPTYRVGIKARGDVTKVIDAKLESGYYVLTVSSPEAVGEVVKELVSAGILVTEVKEMDNPLESLFTGG